MATRGLCDKELGRLLGNTCRTMQNEVTGILAKTGCRSRVELVGWMWRQCGLTRPGALVKAEEQGYGQQHN